MSKLISPDRVETDSYYLRYTSDFRLAGFIEVTPYLVVPEYKTWGLCIWNPFSNISHVGKVDEKETHLLPVFVNDVMLPDKCFDGDDFRVVNKEFLPLSKIEINELNQNLPAIAFFMGNDDWSYALRFSTFKERDDMIMEFGEELGTGLKLIGHN